MCAKEVLRCSSGGITCVISADVSKELLYLINDYLGSDAAELISNLGYLMLCRGVFNEAYLIPPKLKDIIKTLFKSGRVPYSAGLYLGRIRKFSPKFIPSINLLQLVYDSLGFRSALIIREEGLKPFLYGNDVLKVSVINCFEPVRRGYLVGIVGLDGFVYGVGLSVINSCRELRNLKDDDLVARNVFDVGWFLRGGTELRERMFKI